MYLYLFQEILIFLIKKNFFGHGPFGEAHKHNGLSAQKICLNRHTYDIYHLIAQIPKPIHAWMPGSEALENVPSASTQQALGHQERRGMSHGPTLKSSQSRNQQ